MEYNEALDKRQRLLFPGIKINFNEPLYVTRGANQYLYDHQGGEYLDFYAGVATASMGYANREINDGIVKQLNLVQHLHSFYLNQPMLELAEQLIGLLDKNDYQIMFCNSGSEGIEYLALLCRLAKSSGYILHMADSYHGMTLLSNYLTGIPAWKHHGDVRLRAYQVDTPYCYRCQYGLTPENCGVECALSVEKAILKLGQADFAAFLFEAVLGVGGIIVPPPQYFATVSEIVKKYHGLLIADEVQTGIGRTGKWFGFQNYDLVPEAFCLGKALGNGLPIGAVVAQTELAKLTGNRLLYSTFGGNPVTCSSALATLRVIDQHKMLASVTELGKYLFDQLQVLYDFPFIGEIRGLGLMIGIEIVADRISKHPAPAKADWLANRLKDEKILVGLGGTARNVIRLAPPFVINRGDIDHLVKAFREIAGKDR
jgi:4-aminobutyrate aminotransferase-like enzyme